jgi:hypothetical protein
MKEKLIRFFSGRNGSDTLSYTALALALVFEIVGAFVPNPWVRMAFGTLTLLLLGYSFFRIFSRNLAARRRENAAFREFFHILKLKWKGRREYRYFRCPHCRAWLRIPKKKGHILAVTCRACQAKFDKKA